MDGIRFNRPEGFQNQNDPENYQNQPVNEINKSKNKPNFKKILKSLLIAILVVAVVFGAYYVWISLDKNVVDFDPTASEYYALFLTNGQVYFGKPVKKNKSEFVISDVYYLQVTDTTTTAAEQLTEPRFSLVKLGQELHGPTDKLYVNQINLLFYEQLKNDSKVVESIKSYQN